jgi:hypothetical protein
VTRSPSARILVASLLCGAAAAWVAPSGARAQIRGPYLQQGTAESMIVAWRSSEQVPETVCYGDSPDTLTESAGSGQTGLDHAVRITGLSPSTRYYYAVGADSCPPSTAGDPGHHFETSPPVGSPSRFRAWIVGDSGTGNDRQAEVRDAMLEWVGDDRPDLFLHMGDMAYDNGRREEFDANFFGMYESILARTVCWPTIGNHEARSADSASESGPYYNAYVLPSEGQAGGMPSGTEAYYSFNYANAHFVVLDSHESPREPDGTMLRWLERDLASTDQTWIVAYWHHPPYTKGSHDSDTDQRHIDMRENALPILESHGVDVVLGGHSHIYERSYLVSGAYDTPTTAEGHIVDDGDGRQNGDGAYEVTPSSALYVVAGHGGQWTGGDGGHPLMFFSEAENGSCIVDVEGTQLTLRNIRYDGEITDRVTLVKSRNGGSGGEDRDGGTGGGSTDAGDGPADSGRDSSPMEGGPSGPASSGNDMLEGSCSVAGIASTAPLWALLALLAIRRSRRRR